MEQERSTRSLFAAEVIGANFKMA